MLVVRKPDRLSRSLRDVLTIKGKLRGTGGSVPRPILRGCGAVYGSPLPRWPSPLAQESLAAAHDRRPPGQTDASHAFRTTPVSAAFRIVELRGTSGLGQNGVLVLASPVRPHSPNLTVMHAVVAGLAFPKPAQRVARTISVCICSPATAVAFFNSRSLRDIGISRLVDVVAIWDKKC